jgi:hypothetical protein
MTMFNTFYNVEEGRLWYLIEKENDICPEKTTHEYIPKGKTNVVDPYQCHLPPFFLANPEF